MAKECPRDNWIQCDSCFRWRIGVVVKPFTNGLCQRWFCSDAQRSCLDPCDHCRGHTCLCKPSQSYYGYSTAGYSLPDGFSVLIRFRHAERAEVGKPWLTYRSWCEGCGKRSRGLDRRDYMEQWLDAHRGHNAKWELYTAADFDFKVEGRTRELYAVYNRLLKRGVMQKGLREAVKTRSIFVTESEWESLRLLLEMVEASRFFDEEGQKTPKGLSRKRSASLPPSEGNSSHTSLPNKASRKRSNRKAKPPEWMLPGNPWVLESTSDHRQIVPICEMTPVKRPPLNEQAEKSLSSIKSSQESSTSLLTTEPTGSWSDQLLPWSLSRRKDKCSMFIDISSPTGDLSAPFGSDHPSQALTMPWSEYQCGIELPNTDFQHSVDPIDRLKEDLSKERRRNGDAVSRSTASIFFLSPRREKRITGRYSLSEEFRSSN